MGEEWLYFVAEDHGHRRILEADEPWVALCGWGFPRELVQWVGLEPPLAFPACTACSRLGTRLLPHDPAGSVDTKVPVTPVVPITVAALTPVEQVAAAQRRRLWADVDHVSHRVLAHDLDRAVCGAPLPEASPRRTKGPTGPVRACTECERASQHARDAARRQQAKIARPRPTPKQPARKQPVQRQVGPLATLPEPTRSETRQVGLFGRRLRRPVRTTRDAGADTRS